MKDILKRIGVGCSFVIATELNSINMILGIVGFIGAYAVLDWYTNSIKK